MHINDCGGTIVAGQNCTLVCSVSGVSSSNLATISYQWTKNNGTAETQVGNNSSMLVFSSLRLSDAGRYTCQVTVGSEMFGYSEYINIHSEIQKYNQHEVVLKFINLYITVPPPHLLTLISTPPTQIRPIGTNVTLTCTVELSPAVDVPVTVNVQISDPAGRTMTTTQAPSMSGSNYTTEVIISSLGEISLGTTPVHVLSRQCLSS